MSKGDSNRTADYLKYRRRADRLYGIRRYKPLICLCGKSGVGKTAIAEASDLLEVVSYTSRPRRTEEEDGVHYRFRPRSFFDENRDMFRYDLKEFNGCLYGAADEDLEAADIFVVLLRDAIDLRRKGLAVKIVWVDGPIRELRNRPEDVECSEEMREQVDHVLYNVGDLRDSVRKLRGLL